MRPPMRLAERLRLLADDRANVWTRYLSLRCEIVAQRRDQRAAIVLLTLGATLAVLRLFTEVCG